MSPRAAWLAGALLAGCTCGEEPAPAAAPTPAAPAPIAAGRALAAPGAFALTPVADGALLAWGAPRAVGGGVRTLRLGPLGQALDRERAVTERGAAGGGAAGGGAAGGGAAGGGAAEEHLRQAVEVDAFAVGGRVGLAWVIDDGHHLSVQSTFSPDGGARFAEPTSLGRTERLSGPRGRLAMSGDPEQLRVYHRLERAPCVAAAGDCARFDQTDVTRGEPPPDRRVGVLEIGRPCEPLVAGSVHAGGTWYYGVCSLEDAAPRTTVYVIRSEVSYAAAVPFDGCEPDAMTGLGADGVVVRVRCGGEARAVRLDVMGREVERFDGFEAEVACEDGRPTLEVRGGGRPRTLRLNEAHDHLEAMLPPELAPSGARAVWTGEALLVAWAEGRELFLRRHQCVDGRLRRTGAP